MVTMRSINNTGLAIHFSKIIININFSYKKLAHNPRSEVGIFFLALALLWSIYLLNHSLTV